MFGMMKTASNFNKNRRKSYCLDTLDDTLYVVYNFALILRNKKYLVIPKTEQIFPHNKQNSVKIF